MKKCNYCGLEKSNLIQLDGVYICDSCKEIVNKESQLVVNKLSNNVNKILSPREIKEILDKYVVKQDEAKIALATEIYNHLKRNYDDSLASVDKNNILLMGPSGCGKTYLVSTIAKILDIPMITVNATEFTASGYVGKSVDAIGKWMLKEADGDYDKAEKGIVYIDEIDKIACQNANQSLVSGQRDVGGLEVQKELLKIIEGTDLRLDSEFGFMDDGELDFLNTKNMLFIFSGAFEALDKIDDEKSIKLINDSRDFIDEDFLISDKLIKYGFLKEFIGRIPIITQVTKLDENDIIEIMTKKENSIITQYKKIFASDDINITFTDEAIQYFAKMALKSNLGARGLRSIVGGLMNKLIYNNCSTNKSKIIVNKQLIDELLNKNLINR